MDNLWEAIYGIGLGLVVSAIVLAALLFYAACVAGSRDDDRMGRG